MSKDTLFTNDSGAAGGAIDYVKDVFYDVSLAPNSNSGYTDTALTNPMGYAFGNDDTTKFSAKTLFIKDLALVQDRSKWINNKPTYQVIFTDSFPAVNAYLFGNFNLLFENNQDHPLDRGQMTVQMKTIGDGMGITGVIRRVNWLVNDDTPATATGQLALDGVNTSTIDFSGLASDSDATNTPRYSSFSHATSNETRDLHDFRLTALQANTLRLIGCIVYFENSGQNIDQFPGTTYVDKNKITSSLGATFSIPSYGATTGGVDLIYKTASAGYARSSLGASTVTSIGQGTALTNIINVSTGHGSSFLVGSGLASAQGTSGYVGSVLSVSTDALTMSSTLGFGLSNTVYRAWISGSTYGINASLMQLAYSIDFSKYQFTAGVSTAILDAVGRFAFWGSNIGVTNIDNVPAAYFLGASGFMQTDGYFSGAEVEMIGNGIFHASLSINGTPGWSQNSGQTGAIRKTVFTEAGPGWNSFNLSCGASHGVLGISKVNLYTRNRTNGITLGLLSQMDTLQGLVDRGSVSATIMSLGTARRFYADQLYLKGNWIRGLTFTVAGGAYYSGSTTNAVLQFQYYGKDYALIGLASGGTLTFDSSGTALTFNAMKSVATEGFHTIQYTAGAGTTTQIHAIDIVRAQSNFKCLQTINPKQISVPSILKNKSPTFRKFTSGSGTYAWPQDATSIRVRMVGGGAGGSGGGTSPGVGGSGGDTTFGTSLLTAGGGSGGAGGAGGGSGGAGGASSIGNGPVGIALTGSSGGAGLGITSASNAEGGGSGGVSALGGGQGQQGGNGTGQAGAPNTGSGGSGGGASTAAGGGGGGSGGYVEAWLLSPTMAYAYTVGAGGTAGTAGGAGNVGGTGGSGVILIEEYYT